MKVVIAVAVAVCVFGVVKVLLDAVFEHYQATLPPADRLEGFKIPGWEPEPEPMIEPLPSLSRPCGLACSEQHTYVEGCELQVPYPEAIPPQAGMPTRPER